MNLSRRMMSIKRDLLGVVWERTHLSVLLRIFRDVEKAGTIKK